jgi:phage terminase large subunit
VFQQVERVIREAGLLQYFTINKSDALITCTVNGYQIIFAGLDDVEKIKSIVPAVGVLTDIWIEEATETERNDVKDLYKRQRGGDESTRKRMILSFNPILQSHWIYEEHFKSIGWADDQKEYNTDELFILKTTYKDNRFLTTQDTHDLENERDKYRYNVYTLGKWGILGHVIFANWRVEDLSEMMPQFTNHRNGLDFGFSSDPAALWVAHYDSKNKRIYVFDELYERGLTNDKLADELKAKIGDDYVVCDSAEPKSIAELRQYGIGAMEAKKGKDSVLHGIQWMQQQEIIIGKNCVNAAREISTYHWQEDAGGNALRKPSEKNNHLIDAGRYAHEADMVDQWLMI